MRIRSVSTALTALGATLLTSSLSAQHPWANFTDETGSRISAAAGLVVNDNEEKDYVWGDLDMDGDTDLVIVRKTPFTFAGGFPNVLLMNEDGVLTDRTAQWASNQMGTVGQAGSSGFLDATNDRDVVIADVNNDGWPDLVTCITLAQNESDIIAANRVYLNQGETGGVWNGFLFDDWQRIDHQASWGDKQHRFCSVKAGDVNGDGYVDIYFGDYQQGGSRPIDHNDKLLLNVGASNPGYFVDGSSNMTAQMLDSSFGMETDIVDMNGDGKLDIVKATALAPNPVRITISYNDRLGGGSEGIFDTYTETHAAASYNFELGDLNNDGLLDMITSDDAQDRYLIQDPNSPGADGIVDWSASAGGDAGRTFSFVGGGNDDGFGGNNIIADIDGDGWNDAIIADVDVDIGGCNRRCHIYRNLGDAPNITLQEQIIGGEVLGGITPGALQGTFEVGCFDINGDGLKDLIIGRCTGTQVYIQESDNGLSTSYVGGLPSFVGPGECADLVVDVTGTGISPLTGTGVLWSSVNGSAFAPSPMTDNGAGRYEAHLPVLAACGDQVNFYVSVQGSDGITYNDPPTAPGDSYLATAALGTGTIYSNDFEANATGWVVNEGIAGATTGNWERAAPQGTQYLGNAAQPDDDAQAPVGLGQCFVTQAAAGGGAGSFDVDGGPTTLTSPAIDYGGTDGDISFQAWFHENETDTLDVLVSNDDGATFVPVMSITSDLIAPDVTNEWKQYSFRVSDYVTPSANVKVRFSINDTSGSILEAAIDVFQANALTCDTCQEWFAPAVPAGNTRLSLCGGDLSLGTTTDLRLACGPAFSTGLLFFSPLPVVSPLGAGTIIPPDVVLGLVPLDANGGFLATLPVGGFLPPGFSLYLQAFIDDTSQPLNAGLTNAVKVTWN